MVEVLELHNSPIWSARVEAFKGWYQHSRNTWTWESKDSKKEWNYGSAKRAQSAPVRKTVTDAERVTPPREQPLAW